MATPVVSAAGAILRQYLRESLGIPTPSAALLKAILIASTDRLPTTPGTSRQKAAERKGKPPSWSVCQIWDYWPEPKFLFLRHVWRDRVAWDGLKSNVRRVLEEWHPRRVLIENAHHGPPLASELGHFATELVSPIPTRSRGEEGRPGKLERATTLLDKLERGEIFLPRYNNQWLPELEGEWLACSLTPRAMWRGRATFGRAGDRRRRRPNRR